MPELTMDLTIYDHMETEQLEQLLREDANAAGQVLDPRTLVYITGILAQSKQMPSLERTWKDFQEHYRKDRTPVKARNALLWRRIAAVAAMVVLLFSLPHFSNANECGYHHGHRAVWNEDEFWFEWIYGKWPDRATWQLSELSLEELQQMGCCPAWLPEGFELHDRQDIESDGLETVLFKLYDGDKDLFMSVHETSQYHPFRWEVNGDSVQRYYCRGRTYYIFRNMDRYGACWIQNGLECNVSGMLSVWEIREMIHSLK